VSYENEIRSAATKVGLDPTLIMGQVKVESNGNAWAWNPEPLYHYFWDVRLWRPFRTVTLSETSSMFPPSDFPALAGDHDQEWWGQQSSWGLLQVMGAVAREHGFKGPYLSQLCDPAINLDLGCAYLASLVAWSKGNVAQALAAYNGGKAGNLTAPFRNQRYVDKVLAAQASFKEVS
jgi:hypothetical protein